MQQFLRGYTTLLSLPPLAQMPTAILTQSPRPSATVRPFMAHRSGRPLAAEGIAEKTSWSAHGFPSPEWICLMKQTAVAMARERGPLTLALPCIGIDACCHALVELGVVFLSSTLMIYCLTWRDRSRPSMEISIISTLATLMGISCWPTSQHGTGWTGSWPGLHVRRGR